MRKLISLIFILSSIDAFCQGITTNIWNALNEINQGYIHHGVSELQSAAKVNSVIAQYYVGVCFENGISLDKNPKEAFLQYRKAAERGLPDAMYHIALFYQNGIVVEKNESRYNEWIKRFQSKGGKLELPDLVSFYNEGLKHPENYAINPNGQNSISGTTTANILNDGNINSNNTVGSNNQTINNITIIQSAASHTQPTKQSTPKVEEKKSDVDMDIPENQQNNENTFALIIANENYQDVAAVPNAINDGEVFAEYCKKTLGLPTSNVVLVKDATYNNIKREINKLSQIANVYKGAAKMIFYYAGHGVPNESTKDAFLLPVDGYGTDTSTGYSLNELYVTLGRMPAEQIVVLLDACFSGTQRGDGMLASARGVAIKAKPNKVDGKMVVLSAAQGDETAYPYEEQRHGLFTYYLLKKLQQTKGNVSLGDLTTYIKDNVGKKSIVVNGKSQTPNVNPSASLGENWKTWTLK